MRTVWKAAEGGRCVCGWRRMLIALHGEDAMECNNCRIVFCVAHLRPIRQVGCQI